MPTFTHPPRRIIKVGGSLLEWPLLPRAIEQWISNQPPALNVLLGGGGQLVDEIRRWDRDFALGEETAHWLAVDALSLTARLLASLLPDAHLVRGYVDLLPAADRRVPSVVIFDPADYLHRHEAALPGRVLPHDWSVTSDAIAARLAETLPAQELVLLKSADPPAGTLAELAAAGYIDGELARRQVPGPQVTLVNLRSQAWFAQ